MAAYDLEEQEQLAAMKAWWEKYGNMITSAALVVALSISGYQGWRWYSASQAGKAGALFAAASQAALEKDIAKTRVLTDELLAKHGSTVPAELAALQVAQLVVDEGKPGEARAYLERVASKGSDALLRDMARLRLAVLMFDAGELDEAFKQLQASPVAALTVRFEDLRGDILFAKAQPAEARAAYQRALDAIAKLPAASQPQGMRMVVQTKLDALGGA